MHAQSTGAVKKRRVQQEEKAMDLATLTAVSPIDGRYRPSCAPLATYFSEYALIKQRVSVEVEYFVALCQERDLAELQPVDEGLQRKVLELGEKFSLDDAKEVQAIERETRHDVKAVEIFIGRRLKDAFGPSRSHLLGFVHFALTSQDINNTSVPMLVRDAVMDCYLPALQGLIGKLWERAYLWREIPMLAHTHGQPATPTTLGKELYVFVERLLAQEETVRSMKFEGKFGGATGGLCAHYVAYPDKNWMFTPVSRLPYV